MALGRRKPQPDATPEPATPEPPVVASGKPVTTRPRQVGRVVVASGRQIDLSDKKQIETFKKRQSRAVWQPRAWYHTRAIPELSFAQAYVRDSMSKVGLVPAILPEDLAGQPIPLNDETAPEGLDPDLCSAILQRLAPFSDYMSSVANKLDVAGECHVAIVKDEDSVTGEKVLVMSSDELTANDKSYFYKKTADDSAGTPLDVVGDAFWRIWQPDGQYAEDPWSHMIALDDPAEILLVSTQAVRGMLRSRLAMAGRLLGIPDELSLESAAPAGQASTEDAGDGEALVDPFIEDLMIAAEAAILDHESAAAVIPLIIRGPAAMLEKITKIDLERPIDEQLLKLREEARKEIGNGVNLPSEIVLGLGATNHWNAEEIKNQTWRNHLEPRAMNICAATTTAFYRPALLENDIDPAIVRRCVIGYDPSWFLGAPNVADEADVMYDNYAISGDYYREVKGVPPDAAPTLEEIKYRLWIKQQEKITIRETGEAPADETEAAPTGPLDEPVEDDTADEPKVDVSDVKDDTAADAPKTASARTTAKLERLGPRLVGIERDLTLRLHAVTEATVSRALEAAGLKARNTIRNKANRSSAAVKRQYGDLLAQVDALPADQIVASLGATTLRSFGLDHEQLLAGALGTLQPKYMQLVRRAQIAAGQHAADASDRELADDNVEQATADTRNAGWLVLAGGATALARDLMFNPHPSAPPVGEYDPDTVVPIGLVRKSLDVAGGAQPSPGTGSTGGMGATAGPTMLDLFKQELGIVDDTYTWDYGDAPRQSFEPHLDLDGVTFSTLDDPVLANGGDWPYVDFFTPGDHPGCLCQLVVSFTQAVALDGEDEEGDA